MKYNIASPIPYIIIFIMMAFVSYFVCVNSENKKRYLNLFTSKTEGTVVEYEFKKGNRHHSSQHIMTIDYEIDGKKYTTTDLYFGNMHIVCNIGDKIDVLYNEYNPEYIYPKFSYDYEMDKAKESRIIVILLTLVVGVFLYIAYSKRKYEIKY